MLIKRGLLAVGLSIGIGLIASSSQAATTQSSGAVVLPYPTSAFTGNIGKSNSESRADIPQHVKAPAGAPNVLLVMTDDVGFAAASAFGGPVPTPSLDRLAENGLKYNRFHTTAMCSPTRASLLTGVITMRSAPAWFMTWPLVFRAMQGICRVAQRRLLRCLRSMGTTPR